MNHRPLLRTTRLFSARVAALAACFARGNDGECRKARPSPGDISRRCNATRKPETRTGRGRGQRSRSGRTFRRARMANPRSPPLMLRGNIAGLLRARHLDLYLLKKSLLPLRCFDRDPHYSCARKKSKAPLKIYFLYIVLE